MREIKFRVWDGNGNRFVNQHSFAALVNPCDGGNHTTELRHGTAVHLMQFTGLTDKNGKEIYEGDVVAFTNSSRFKVVWPIVWDAEAARWCFGYDTGEPAKDWTRKERDMMVVIGNIYENPNLLNHD